MPFDSFDALEAAFQRVQQSIIDDWGNIDVTNTKAKARLAKAVAERMRAMGYEVNESLAAIIAEEYGTGSDEAINQLGLIAMENDSNGSLVTDFKQSIHVQAVQELVLDTGDDLLAALRTAERSGIDDAAAIVNETTNILGDSLITGAVRKEAQRQLMRHFADHGLTAFITSDGKRLPLDFYAQTVTRTKRKVANTLGAVNRYIDNGIQYVMIQGHSPTCGKCASYHGVIVQITGDPQPGIPHISNTLLPPFHPNCRCTLRPIRSLAGVSIKQPSVDDPRTEAQRRVYNAEQKIRQEANREKKQYARMQAEDVEGLPATLGAFRRMKRKNDAKWKALQSEYMSSVHTASAQTSGKYRSDPPREKANREFIEQWRANRDGNTS